MRFVALIALVAIVLMGCSAQNPLTPDQPSAQQPPTVRDAPAAQPPQRVGIDVNVNQPAGGTSASAQQPGYQTAPAGPASSQASQPARTGPQITDLNPNTDAINVGTCKGVTNDYGLYLQSGVDQHCTSRLTQIPQGSVLTVDGIAFRVDGVEYKNTIKAFQVGDSVALELTNGGAVLAPNDMARKRFCDISATATRLNWALPNRQGLATWAACS